MRSPPQPAAAAGAVAAATVAASVEPDADAELAERVLQPPIQPVAESGGEVRGSSTSIGSSRSVYFSGWRICSVESGGSANAASTASQPPAGQLLRGETSALEVREQRAARGDEPGIRVERLRAPRVERRGQDLAELRRGSGCCCSQ